MLAHGGLVIKKMRKMRGYTQTELSISYGITKNTISNWERQLCEPSFMTVFNIGRYLRFDIIEIYHLTNELEKELRKAA